MDEVIDYKEITVNGKKVQKKILRNLGRKSTVSIFPKKSWFKYLDKDILEVAK